MPGGQREDQAAGHKGCSRQHLICRHAQYFPIEYQPSLLMKKTVLTLAQARHFQKTREDAAIQRSADSFAKENLIVLPQLWTTWQYWLLYNAGDPEKYSIKSTIIQQRQRA